MVQKLILTSSVDYEPTKVTYRGEEISGLKASEIAERGVVRTFQRTALFHNFAAYGKCVGGPSACAKLGLLRTIFGPNRGIEKRT